MSQSKDWVMWCRSRKKDAEHCPFEADGKEIFSNRSKQTKVTAGEKINKKGPGGKGPGSQCAEKRGGDKATSNVQ